MTLYTVITTFGNGLFGSYSTLLRARKAVEHYFKEAIDVVSFEDVGDYAYQCTTDRGEVHSVAILADTLDWEYETGEINEGN